MAPCPERVVGEVSLPSLPAALWSTPGITMLMRKLSPNLAGKTLVQQRSALPVYIHNLLYPLLILAVQLKKAFQYQSLNLLSPGQWPVHCPALLTGKTSLLWKEFFTCWSLLRAVEWASMPRWSLIQISHFSRPRMGLLGLHLCPA